MPHLINIAGRLRPFSHEPGAKCLIPGTPYIVEAFPARVRIWEFDGRILQEIELPAKGPLKQFTLMQDLERGCVSVFSEQYRIHILPNLKILFSKNSHLPSLENQERLSFGSHKKMDSEALRRRRDLSALFSIWFRLGSLLKLPPRSKDNRGVFRLLEDCRTIQHPELIMNAFEKLFLVGFESLFIPRSSDTQFQGIIDPKEPSSVDSALYLLTEGAALIRSLFFSAFEDSISILPRLPPQLFAGRMTDVVSLHGSFDFEWTKKTIRRLQCKAQRDGVITINFQPQMVSCRLRLHPKDKGQIFQCGDSLAIKSGSIYLLDRFQK